MKFAILGGKESCMGPRFCSNPQVDLDTCGLTPTRHAPSLVDRKSPPEGLESLSFRRSFRCRHKDFMQLIPVSSSCAVTTLSMCIDFEGPHCPCVFLTGTPGTYTCRTGQMNFCHRKSHKPEHSTSNGNYLDTLHRRKHFGMLAVHGLQERGLRRTPSNNSTVLVFCNFLSLLKLYSLFEIFPRYYLFWR